MTPSALLRLALLLVIVASALHIAPPKTASACSCHPNVPQIAMEQHRTAVIGHAIGEKDNALVFAINSAYGVAVPEQLLIPISQCDSSVVSENRIGFSILRSGDSWDRVVCSTVNETDAHLLAVKAGLSRNEVLPVANPIRFDAEGDEIVTAAGSLASDAELIEKDLVDPGDRQPGDQSVGSPGNAMSAVLIAFGAALVLVLAVTMLTNRRGS